MYLQANTSLVHLEHLLKFPEELKAGDAQPQDAYWGGNSCWPPLVVVFSPGLLSAASWPDINTLIRDSWLPR